MSKKRTLKIRGALYHSQSVLPAVLKAREFLDALPVDEVYNLDALANAIKVSPAYLRCEGRFIGEQYRYKEGTAYGYGNPETIKLKKEGFYER